MDYNKEQLKDTEGRPLTQGLFLEPTYKTNYAIFTFDDNDKVHKGKKYISLKRLYLEEADLTEYQFATKYLLGWNHWNRMKENKLLNVHFEQWKEELHIKLRSEAIRGIVEDMSDNFQALKWLAEAGWEKKGPGRPKKQDLLKEKGRQQAIEEEFSGDIIRLNR